MKLSTVSLMKFYAGEDGAGETLWHGGNGPVQYLSSLERQQFEIIIANGLLLNAAGEFFNTNDADGERGRAIYVLDQQGILYCSNRYQHFKFHHSSLVAGEPVACAGEIAIMSGMVFYLDNASGHYNPGALHLSQMDSYLRGKGVNYCLMGRPKIVK